MGVTRAVEAAGTDASGAWGRPYRPSAFSRFERWLDARSGRATVFYLLLAASLVGLESWVKWRDGAYPVGSLYAPHVVLATSGVFVLWVVHALDRAAARILEDMRPVLDLTDASFRDHRWRLTTMPANGATWASTLAAAIAVALGATLAPRYTDTLHLATSPLAFGVDLLLYAFVWWCGGLFLYHSIHQLRSVTRVHGALEPLPFFEARRLYVFSWLTAWTAIAMLAWNYVWIFAFAPAMSDPAALAIGIGVTVLALVVFTWPLLRVRRLLVQGKDVLQTRLDESMTRTLENVHRAAAAGDLTTMRDLNYLIDNLRQEQALLDRASTWPWEPAAVRTLSTAIVVPILVWAGQRFLESLLP